ncbi:SigE family RNA polymerase sigma factor [Catenulispora yoronensis]|uniref:SigE family RNA polymerase sigma factor n=1 Tax=Catenulispora yoronensis TaxID=450799 RepID=UPI0036331D18
MISGLWWENGLGGKIKDGVRTRSAITGVDRDVRLNKGSRGTDRPDHREEFREFAVASQSHLRRSAYLLCGDWHFAEDLVQIAFDRIYRHWHRVRAADNPHAYASRVVFRCYLDSRKKHLDMVPVAHLPEPAARGDSTDTRLTVLEALARLPPRTRAVVVLRYWEDMSVEQTAEILDLAPGSVKSMASRGLGLLRVRLADLARTPSG